MADETYSDALNEYRLNTLARLYDLLMDKAYGKSVDEESFAAARADVLRDSELGGRVPTWLREVRSPRDWSTYANARFSSNTQKREYLRREFAPVFGYVEGLDVAPDRSPIRGDPRDRPWRYPGTEADEEPETYKPGKRVFLVHGHDISPRNAVEAYLRRLGLDPIVLSDVASRGRTIIEKIEAYDEVDYAVIILTPEDVGGLASGAPDNLQPRARQNVILELGYFVGSLGRDYVAALLVGSVEIPSDVRGVVYIPYAEDNDVWKGQLLRELRHAEIPVDLDAI